MLSGNGHDITVIDRDAKALEEVGTLADIITVEGDSTTFEALRKASTRKCDLFIAVNHTENDNIVAAVIAKQLGARKTIARIDNNEYLEPNNKEIFIEMGIDYLFYPEKVAAAEVVDLLGHTSTTEYVDFSGGRLSLSVFKLEPTSPLVGRELAGFSDSDAELSYRTVAITRDGRTIIPHAEERFEEGDTIYVSARQDAVREVNDLSGQSHIEVKNLMILGGSRIGVQVASELQNEVNIKLIDYNAEKAYRLAELLDKTLIINVDGRNTEAMLEEGLPNMDAFLAVTGRSETNILAALLARRMGVKKVIAEVENLNYINLAESMGIDTIVNKKLITASNIFRFHDVVRRAGDQIPHGQRSRGDGVHRQAQLARYAQPHQGDGAAGECHHRRHRPRRQGRNRRREYRDQGFRPCGGLRPAGCGGASVRFFN